MWIKEDGAAPNQFIHPDEPEEPMQLQQPPVYDPSHYGSTSASSAFQYQGPWVQPPPTMPRNQYVGYLVHQVANLSTGIMHMMASQHQQNEVMQNINRRLDNVEASQYQQNEAIQNINRQLDNVEAAHRHLSINWTRQYGDWYTPDEHIHVDATMPQAYDAGTGYEGGGANLEQQEGGNDDDGDDEVIRDIFR